MLLFSGVQVLALAKRMLRGGSAKRSIMEAAYNRYAFHDDNLPEWFREDEEKNMRPIDPVTKEEIEEEKARLRAIDARPLKKVAEAKARKKKRAAAALAKARAQVGGAGGGVGQRSRGLPSQWVDQGGSQSRIERDRYDSAAVAVCDAGVDLLLRSTASV